MKKIYFLFLCCFIAACSTNLKQSDEVIDEPDEYTEKHRLQFHFSPPANWMNDPNGMFYYAGEYHLFYQYYPDSTVWGPMHWGHAVSKDLIYWEHLPIALYPDSLGYIFSGSAVVDWNNTSGFGSKTEPPIVAIFSYHDMDGELEGRNNYQNQGIAYSVDKGRTWTKFNGNPVLPTPGIKDFRDPKVFWYEQENKWIMALAVYDHIRFYSSENLKEWSLESEFGKSFGAHTGVWECPDLFKLKVEGTDREKWVLLVSINPGAPLGGSGTMYFTGEFNGKEFLPDMDQEEMLSSRAVWIDAGRDNYAGVTWSDVPKENGTRTFIGWMSNWSYGQIVPTDRWRSSMTIPRKLSLVITSEGLRLKSWPIDLKPLFSRSKGFVRRVVEDEELLSSRTFPGPAFQMDLEIGEIKGDAFEIELSNNVGEEFLIGFDKSTNSFYTDRLKAGNNDFSKDFGGRHFGKRLSEKESISLRILVDVGSVEVFADGGTVVLTDLFFPTEVMNRVKLKAVQGSVEVKSVEMHKLKSIWKPKVLMAESN
jgi:fructan beta-fructosidase